MLEPVDWWSLQGVRRASTGSECPGDGERPKRNAVVDEGRPLQQKSKCVRKPHRYYCRSNIVQDDAVYGKRNGNHNGERWGTVEIRAALGDEANGVVTREILDTVDSTENIPVDRGQRCHGEAC